MIEIIDDFLQNEKDACNFLDKIAKMYRLCDFVLVDKNTKEYLISGKNNGFEFSYRCIYNNRVKSLYLNTDRVEDRLASNYMDFLWDVLTLKEEENKVKYILAYHYLEMLMQLAYMLTISSESLFTFGGTEMMPMGEKKYALYENVKYGELHDMVPYISKDRLAEYTRIFYQYNYSDSRTKHYSLMEYLLDHEKVIGSRMVSCISISK